MPFLIWRCTFLVKLYFPIHIFWNTGSILWKMCTSSCSKGGFFTKKESITSFSSYVKILKKNKNLSKICHKLWSGLWSISKEKLWYNYSCFGNIWNTVYVFFAKEVCNQHFYYLKYICPRYMHEMDEGSRHHLIAFFLFSLSVLVMYSLRTLNRDVKSLEIVCKYWDFEEKSQF